MSTKATVTSRGAILLGKSVACDAFDETRPIRVVTHAHADHMVGLHLSLKKCEKVVMTKATKDLIDVMRGHTFLTGGIVETLDYGRTVQVEEERMTFFKADHMLGATQVLVEDVEGKRVVFTGDFRIDDTPVLEADILVMEATYGSPICKRSFGVDVKNQLVSLVERGLKEGAVHIFGHYGKLQEVMHILYNAKVEVPFVAPEKVFLISKVFEKHGMSLGRLMSSSEVDARELIEKNQSCVSFHHMSSRRSISHSSLRVCVSGWEFDAAMRQVAENEYVVALSDHSDFDGLLEYVRRSKPQFVITDNYRVSRGEALAKEIRNRLGISATAMPTK